MDPNWAHYFSFYSTLCEHAVSAVVHIGPNWTSPGLGLLLTLQARALPQVKNYYQIIFFLFSQNTGFLSFFLNLSVFYYLNSNLFINHFPYISKIVYTIQYTVPYSIFEWGSLISRRYSQVHPIAVICNCTVYTTFNSLSAEIINFFSLSVSRMILLFS